MRLRRYMRQRRYKVKRIHKSWVGFGTGLRAVLCDLLIVLQLCGLVALYGFTCWKVPVIWYVSIALTVLTIAYVLIYEEDKQSKISWALLLLFSAGSGFYIYVLSRKAICYGYKRQRYAKIVKKAKPLVGSFHLWGCSDVVRNDCCYLYDKAGFVPYYNTQVRYYPYAREILDNIIARVDNAEKFVFMEFFILADGVLLDRLISVFRRKVAQGVEIRVMYDDVGSAGVLSSSAKKRIKATGVKLKAFSPLCVPFYFGLNYRDHRKIVVVDGKTGYIGGFNLIDDCANQRRMEGIWKDAGLRLDGHAVDGLSLTFMRQWEFGAREKLDYTKYLDNYDRIKSDDVVVPYAGGPHIRENVCREVYKRIIEQAKDKLYIMTPYLVPDSKMTELLKEKAQAGVDVRIVLPGVPDYRYIYRVTQANALKLIKSGVKVYYSSGEFVHSKVMLSEHCAAVSSVNLDMRAFYQELENGVYLNGESVLKDIEKDFNEVFARGGQAKAEKPKFYTAVIAGILRLVSPLM